MIVKWIRAAAPPLHLQPFAYAGRIDFIARAQHNARPMRQFSLLDDLPSASETHHDLGPDAAEILSGLNPAQREAAETTDGPVLIVAGPGSGKTRTLTHRIAYLLASGKARPYEILALTFTNKAAREMRQRIEHLVGAEHARGIWMGTFHSLFARLLRIEGERIGFTSDFTIYDSDDSQRVVRSLMDQYHIDSKQFTPRTLQSLISNAKNQLVNPTAYGQMAATLAQDNAARVYGPYEDFLRRSNAMDFDDLLIRPIELFERAPEVLEKYQRRWRYIHIDEYQDTNRAQYMLARRLAGLHKNLCVVGDDAQSIYAFRGADIGNILSFQRDYGDAKTVRLEQNYRSTRRILALAQSIIKNNTKQLEKSLWTDNKEGDHVVLIEALSEKDEAQKIERYIRDMRTRFGFPFRDFAVLYRTNAQSRSIEDVFRRAGIPYRLIGGVAFYQRKEIKDVLAYLRLVVNLSDEVSLRRILNYPTRGIGAKTEEQLIVFARENGLTLWQAIERIGDAGLSSRARKAVQEFSFLISRYAAKIDSMPAEEIARGLAQEAGLLEDLRKENTPEGLMRWENVQELISAIAEHAAAGDNNSLSTFLQEVSLITDADSDDRDDNKVTLMTLHASKGLEFPAVFISGMEEGLFPLARAAQDATELEEERRLFYVGATRAKEMLFLSHARSRYRYGQHESSVRSRFLDEIDADVIRTEAGDRHETRSGRFSLQDTAGPFSYSGADPHYWRRNLQEEKRAAAQDTGRRIVYEEGEGQIVPGARVEHEQFGEGKVLSMEGAGEQTRAVVFFKEVGQKKMALRFARLRRIG